MNNTEEFKMNLFNQIREDGGKTKEEAEELVTYFTMNEAKITSFKNTIRVSRSIPLRYVEDTLLTKSKPEIDKLLFNLGFDTINSSYVIDVHCYTWEGKTECGKVLLGQERLDPKWMQSDRKSDDAFHYMNREIMREV